MKYISEFKEGDRVIDFYFCRDKQMLVTKAGKDYYKLTLEDKTGSIPAMIWEIGPLVGDFSKGDIVKVDGKVQTYQDAPQLTITKIRRANDNEADVQDLFRTSRTDPDKLYQKALGMIEQIHDSALKRLVFYFYRDNDAMAKKLVRHPAAKNVHHGYIGGLIEHSVSVAQIAVSYRDLYPQLDQDLLIAGGLLHDIGKLKELDPLPLLDYSDEGRLLGHITMGYQMVHEQGSKMADLDPAKLLALDHMILSHHGKLEFASPVVPETMEAMALNLADLSDSQLKLMEDAIGMDSTEGSWTSYNRAMERYFYKG